MATFVKIFDFVVPAGRVLYVEKIAVIVDTTNNNFPAVLPSKPFDLTAKIDGSADRWNQNITLTATEPEIDTFIIVGQNQRLTLWMDIEKILTEGFISVQGHARVVGDVLLVNKNSTPYTATLDEDSQHERKRYNGSIRAR